MDITVTTRNCEVPSRLRREAMARVEHATRFFSRLSGVEMVFSEEANPRIPEPAVVELTARAKGHYIRAQGCGEDHRGAVDAAVTRFERQLARYKARLVDRRRHPRDLPAGGENGPVLEPERPREPAEQPVPIVRRKQFGLTPMLPEDAALQLDLLDHHFYLFVNAATGRCSVVYRRRDGSCGLIEALAPDEEEDTGSAV